MKEDLAFDIGQMVLEARMIQKITQKELARRMKTKQPSLARVENGRCLPSLKFLVLVVKGLKTKLIPPSFECVKYKKII